MNNTEKFFVFICDEENTGKRLDVYLTEELDSVDGCDGITRSAVQNIIDNNNADVNGKAARSSHKLKRGDIVNICIPNAVETEILPEDIPLCVLHEDNEIIVINKPQGMVVHPAAGHYTGTVVNAVLYRCKSGLSGINGVMRPGIVHRIDKDTSGVIVVAKTNKAHICLAKQFAEHTVKREYDAIASGNIKLDELTVNKPIGRHPTERKKMSVNTKNGREAVTHIRVIQRFGVYTKVKAILETGRTHQIRVHMADIGHPLLGDEVYGHKKQRYSLKGQALHAGLLGFEHPSGGYVEFRAALPEYFNRLCGEGVLGDGV